MTEDMKKIIKDFIQLLLDHATATDGDVYFIKIKKSTLDNFIDSIK